MICRYCGKSFVQHRDIQSQNIHYWLKSCLECYFEGIVPPEDVRKAMDENRYWATRKYDHAFPRR